MFEQKKNMIHLFLTLHLLTIIVTPAQPTTLPPTFTPEQLFASFEENPTFATTTTPTTPTTSNLLPDLQHLIEHTDPIELRSILIDLGYSQASLGTPHHSTPPPKSSNTATTNTIKETHAGEFCQTHVQPHHITIPSGTPLPSHYTVLVEEDSSITAHQKTLDGKKGDPVTCSCDEFECTCRKQCLCKTQSQPFPTNQPSSCPICKTCDGAPVPADDADEDDDDDSPEKPNPAPHEFKCTCSFDGGGSADNIGGGTNAMDCDCKVSDCSCTRKCKCRAT